jgi:integrase/recombinase XerD
MRTTSAKAKPSQGLSSVIAATKKLWRQYHLTYDQPHYVAKEVRRALALERPKTRERVVARLSREEERTLIAHAYRVQGTRGLLIKTLFQTGARVSECVNITADEVFFKEQMILISNLLERGMPIEQIQKFPGHSKLETTQIYAESSAEMIKESYQWALGG